ncbi:MAG: DUF1801 domain-containing protein [Cyanobacteria bacterium P01_D01_bin.14]
MSDLKTQENDASVDDFIASVENEARRQDCLKLLSMMKRITKKPAKMWGTSIVGFGSYHYTYKSGRSGDWFVTGCSPRKRDLTVYIMPGFEKYAALMETLGKYKAGKSCLYIKRLSDVDLDALEALIARSVMDMQEMYGCR